MNSNCMRAAVALFTAAFLCAPGMASERPAPNPADVRDILTVNQFHQAGIDKLSSDELAALNAWLGSSLNKLAPSSNPAAKALDVRDLMSVNEFRQTGLDKLTPDELAALNASLGAAMTKPAATPIPAAVATAPVALTRAAPAATTAAFGKEMLAPLPQDAAVPDMLTARISGLFLGWRGETVFKLDNGQVWQQAEPGMFDTRMQNPEITIKKLRFGYLLTFPGRSETLLIRRLH
ncbi:MAG TPA: hypothetical protein VLG68_06345 [Gammaproteobacteria bacterium]|nr:hypothetical protein [Gammaproteobacteria bacterium]